MLIAIPSDMPGGLDAPISEHFGHCDVFTLIHVSDGKVGEVRLIPNGGHEHGGCMAPVHLLKDNGVEVLVAGGMGMRPLAGFQSVGIDVFFKEDASTVRDAVSMYTEGKCRPFGKAQTCGGGAGQCGGHHGHEAKRPPIEGPADVRDGRIVTMEFAIRDEGGNLIEASEPGSAMRYLQGSGGIEGLEKAIAGKQAGDEIRVTLQPSEAFGDHDEQRIIEVPRSKLPQDVTLGEIVTAQHSTGAQVHMMVIDVNDESVRLDGNHPLAGKVLQFEVKILKVEAATEDEIEHGHVH